MLEPRANGSGTIPSQTAEHIVVVNYVSVKRVHPPRNNSHEVAFCRAVMLKVPEARSRKLPQSDSEEKEAENRNSTTAKEQVAKRRQGSNEDSEKYIDDLEKVERTE